MSMIFTQILKKYDGNFYSHSIRRAKIQHPNNMDTYICGICG